MIIGDQLTLAVCNGNRGVDRLVMDEQEAGRRIEIGTKLTKGNNFVVLGKVELQVISITDGQTLEVESSLWCLSCHQHQLLCLPCWLYCRKEVHWFPEGEQWGVKFRNGCERLTLVGMQAGMSPP